MSYKTPLKPVTHGVLKRYDFLDKAQNEAVNERDNRKIYVGKVSMSPFLYFCFLLQIPVCVSIFFFSSKIFRDSGCFVCFLLTFCAGNWRVTGLNLTRLRMPFVWPLWSLRVCLQAIQFLWSTHSNVCNLFKFKITVSQLSKRWQNSHKL